MSEFKLKDRRTTVTPRRVSDRVNADAMAMAERVAQEVERQYQAAVAERDAYKHDAEIYKHGHTRSCEMWNDEVSELKEELAAAKAEAKRCMDAEERMHATVADLMDSHAAAIAEAEERALEWACSVQHARWTDYKSASEAWDKHGPDLVRAYRASQQQPAHKPWCLHSDWDKLRKEDDIVWCTCDTPPKPEHKPWCLTHTKYPALDHPCTCERRVHQRRDGKDRRAWLFANMRSVNERRVNFRRATYPNGQTHGRRSGETYADWYEQYKGDRRQGA